MKSITHCCPGYSTRDRDTCYILNIRISPRVIFLLIRSILVFTKASYFGFICPDSNKLSKNSRRNPEQIHQMMNPVWKENPLGIMKFDIVEILVLENKIISSIVGSIWNEEVRPSHVRADRDSNSKRISNTSC